MKKLLMIPIQKMKLQNIKKKKLNDPLIQTKKLILKRLI